MAGPAATVPAGLLAQFPRSCRPPVLARLEIAARKLKRSADQIVVLIHQQDAITNESGYANLV
jgi:hypothetical protein